MARPIHSEFGPDTKKKQVARAKSGGIKSARDVMGYKAPSIPGWDPHGSKSPGLGGDVYEQGLQNCDLHTSEGGGVGIGGERKRKGSQG